MNKNKKIISLLLAGVLISTATTGMTTSAASLSDLTYDWQLAYYEWLASGYLYSDNAGDDPMYDFYNINNDEIPELFISGGLWHTGAIKIYTVNSEGNLIDLTADNNELGTYGTIRCDDNSGYVMNTFTSVGYATANFYVINGDTLEIADAFSYMGPTEEEYTYRVNETVVTKADYYDAYAYYDNIAWDSVGRKYAFEGTYADALIAAETLINSPIIPTGTGDVDGDSSINSSDASLVLSEYAAQATGGITTLNDAQIKASDVNSDGAVDSSDASMILSYYAYTATGGVLSFTEYSAI